MERATAERVHIAPQEQNLYGVRLLLSGEHQTSDVARYIQLQEKTHIAEGLELQQRTVRVLQFDGENTLGFGGQPMVEVNQSGYRDAKKQYLAGDKEAHCLMKRREHDVTISKAGDALMKDGQVGDAIMVISPYQEELDNATAKRLGFWPEKRRSYAWVYRKKNDHQLECTDVSIDNSRLSSFVQLLQDMNVEVPTETASHDIPSYMVNLRLPTNEDSDHMIDSLLHQYQTINHSSQSPQPKNQPEAMDFLDKKAQHHLALMVEVHLAIADSIASGSLHQLVRLSASKALSSLNCLSPSETASLQSLLVDQQIGDRHHQAFATLISAQRYGVWQGLSQMAGTNSAANFEMSSGGSPAFHQAKLLDDIYKNTNAAAMQSKTMPGCAGGSSFFNKSIESVKDDIFNGEKYSFDKNMFCVVCQAPPKEDAKKKMCGPCGICKGCDTKLKVKPTKAA